MTGCARISAAAGAVVFAGLILSAQTQQAQPPPPTFRAGASLVRVDVTVTDHHGEPVTSLTADDFEVQEDGAPQTVETFKLVSADGRPAEGDDTSLAIRSPEHAAAEAARDEVRVFLIFWDEYHIGRFASAIHARKALADFVSSAFGPTDLVALMDPLTPTDAIRWTRNYSDLALSVHKLEGRYREYLPPRSVLEEAQLGRRDVERLRSEVTISAVQSAASYLGGLREGRKAIIFISEGLPGLYRSDEMTLLQDMVRAANNNTAIYTLDPRGLIGASGDQLRLIADSTGAEAFVNTNAPEKALRQVVKDASAFYLLGYASTRNPADGKFHQIKVRVRKSGLDVRARKGYWAPTASDMDRAAREAAAEPPTEVTTALAPLTAARPERIFDVWIGASPAADRTTDVLMTWTPRQPQATATVPQGTMSVVLKGAGEKQLYEAPLDAHRLLFKAEPGALDIQMTIRGLQGQTLDEDARQLVVPDFARERIALSSPAVLRVRNPTELRSLRANRETTPFAGREFTRTDRLFIRFAVHGESADHALVSARLLNRTGAALLPLTVAAVEGAAGAYEIDLPLASVARGDYLIEITAAAGDERARDLVPVRVVSYQVLTSYFVLRTYFLLFTSYF
jgi:VWFA-related protein